MLFGVWTVVKTLSSFLLLKDESVAVVKRTAGESGVALSDKLLSNNSGHIIVKSKLDDESREMFVNTLFSLFEATGMATFGEMILNGRTSAGRIMDTMKNLPGEKQAELKAVMGELVRPAGIEPAVFAFGGRYSIH